MENIVEGPARALANPHQRAAASDPAVDFVRLLRQIAVIAADQHDVAVIAQIGAPEMPLLHHVDRHLHARVELVPDFAGVVGLNAFADEQKHGRLGNIGEAGAAEVHAGDRGVRTAHRMHYDAVLDGDLAHELVNFRIRQVAALPAEGNENRAGVEVDRFAAADDRQRLGRHFGPRAGVEQSIQGPRRVIVRPGKEVGEIRLGGRGGAGKFGARFVADHVPANISRIERRIVEIESQRHCPGGHIVESLVFELGDQLEQGLDHAVLRLVGLHDVGIPRGKAHPARFDVPVQAPHADLMPMQQIQRVVRPGGIAGGGKHIGFHRVVGREFGRFAGEIALELQQFAAHFDTGADHFQRGAELRAGIVAER